MSPLVILLAAALVLTVIVWMVSVFRHPAAPRREAGVIRLIFPGGSKTAPIDEGRPHEEQDHERGDGRRHPRPTPNSSDEAVEIPRVHARNGSQRADGWERGTPNGATASGADDDRVLAGETVQFRRPQDEAVQLLPGRLEVVDGEDPNEEVRFVRVPGELPQITFGREAGPPHRHVRLRTMTASRLHARMTYRSGRWTITNLSATNPVHINDIAIESVGEGRVLDDGDRIEMGEIVFRFRSH
ncbi:MAG: FHA domain-containing protein [Gemmatimonadota bacterium]|nr:FHA domain-containing protein [Gemmatimonadota bacterium]